MTEKGKETIASDVLLKEEAIGELERAISDFQNPDPEKAIGGLKLLIQVKSAWGKANENETLKAKIEKRMRRMRLALHQMTPLDISKHGDPIMQRYNPNYWLEDERIRFENEEEIGKFILERTRTLKEFFENL